MHTTGMETRMRAARLLAFCAFAVVWAASAHAQNCGVASVEIRTTVESGGSDTFYQDTLIAKDANGGTLWTRRAPLSPTTAYQPFRMADAWLEIGAADSNVVLFLTDGRLRVFGCDGQPLRSMWFSDRLPEWGWEIKNGLRNADGRSVRIYGVDHVGPALRAFALDVDIAAMLDTSTTVVASDRRQTAWEWSTSNDQWVWDEHSPARLDLVDSTLVLRTGRQNPFYDGTNRSWLEHAHYEMDPLTGSWTNSPCLAGDLTQNGLVERADAARTLLALLDYSRGRDCRDPSYPLEECAADLNRDRVLDVEDVVELYLLTAGRGLSVLDAPRDSTRWELVDHAAPDSSARIDRVQLRLTATQRVLGFHLRFEGPLPTLIETTPRLEFVDGEDDGCTGAMQPVEIVAAGDTAVVAAVLLTLELPRQEDGSFAQELRVLAGSAIGADGIRYDWSEQVVSLVVEDDPPPPPPVTPTPSPLTLHQNRPNPFNPETWIDVEVVQPAHVQLDIYDARGQHVVRLLDRDLTTGMTAVEWKGQDSQGQPVSSGLYYYRIRSEFGEEVRKMALVK